MKAEDIKKKIAEIASLFGFEYNGKEGNVDPCYIAETNSYEFLLYYDGNEITVYDIDSVMKAPFIDGKSLNEVADSLIITEM